MKPIILAIIIMSCTKEAIVEKPIEKSLTYLHLYFDENNTYIKTDTAYHLCSVCCDDLTRFEGYAKVESYCYSNDLLVLNIEKRCEDSFTP